MATISEISLTRAEIEEIVGPEQQKINAFEGLLQNVIIQDNSVTTSDDLTWWVTRWRNGKVVMRLRFTTTSTIDTYQLPYPLIDSLSDFTTMVGTSYASSNGNDITVKFTGLTEDTVNIGATINGALAAATVSVVIEGRYKVQE